MSAAEDLYESARQLKLRPPSRVRALAEEARLKCESDKWLLSYAATCERMGLFTGTEASDLLKAL